MPKSRDQFKELWFRYGLNEKNHWSNLKTTQEYFEHILSSGVDTNQYWVAYIDCWNIHKSKALLDWARAKYPHLLILFVPAGCTGKFQPADLILQRVFKHIICREFNALLASNLLSCTVYHRLFGSGMICVHHHMLRYALGIRTCCLKTDRYALWFRTILGEK